MSAGRTGAGRTRGAAGQVGALLALRLSMLRGAPQALLVPALLLGAALPVLVLGAAVWSGERLPRGVQLQASELSAGAFLLVLLGVVVSALASAGGRELLPRAQLVAYPVSPTAEHLSILLMTPANLAWWLQSLGLFAVMGTATRFEYSTAGTDSTVTLVAACLLVAAVCTAWVLAATCVGQLLSWLVEIVRCLPGGRWAVRLTYAGLVLLAVRSADTATLTRVLGWRPTRELTGWALTSTNGQYLPPLLIVAGLLLTALVATALGARAYAGLLRRPSVELGRRETTVHRSRRLVPTAGVASDVRVWRSQEWALVLRSNPLRRGLLVLVLVPAAGGLLSKVGVDDVVLICGVVASGAGLLFGVNAFSLDADGAVWRETLPVPPRVWFASRAWVLAEIVLGTSSVATLAALYGGTGRIRATTLVVVAVGLVTMTGQVLARCLRWSVHSPQRAELRTPRDSPVSPGRMVACSAQLVGATLLSGTALAVCARFGNPALPLLVCLPSMVLSALSIRRSLRAFDDHERRATIVQAVSRG